MSRKFQRNVAGLRAHALRKAEETHRRAEEALAQLGKEGRPINFKTVASAAGISPSWLYGNDDLRQRITHLRKQQMPKVQVVTIPTREQASSASKDAVIAVLRQRILKLDQKNRDLRRQIEVANGLLYQREGEQRER